MIRHLNSRFERLISALILILVSSAALSQGIQLSPAQQQMLNQLPPAQRQQAMDAIRQLESKQTTASQQSINEPIQQTNSIGSESIDSVLASVDTTAQPRSRLVINFESQEELSAEQRRDLATKAPE